MWNRSFPRASPPGGPDFLHQHTSHKIAICGPLCKGNLTVGPWNSSCCRSRTCLDSLVNLSNITWAPRFIRSCSCCRLSEHINSQTPHTKTAIWHFRLPTTVGFRVDSRPRLFVLLFNPFRAAVPFRGQTIQIPSSLSPKRDCGPERVERNIRAFCRGKPRGQTRLMLLTTV